METAGLGRRIIALFIDWIVAGLSVGALLGTSYPPKDPLENLYITIGYVVEVGVLVALLGYSIGKRIVGIRVEQPNGRPPSLPNALLRTLLICLIIPPLVQNKEGRGLHDVLANTRQIKI